MTQFQTFCDELQRQYAVLFATDPEYAYAAARMTPETLAIKMTASLAAGTANKDGAGIRMTCRMLKIPYTYTAIRAYLTDKGAR